MDNEVKEIYKSLENQTIYDYIASQYYKLSKEQLKDILLEYIYASNYELDNDVLTSLKERWECD